MTFLTLVRNLSPGEIAGLAVLGTLLADFELVDFRVGEVGEVGDFGERAVSKREGAESVFSNISMEDLTCLLGGSTMVVPPKTPALGG